MTDIITEEIIPDTIVCNLTAEIFSFTEQEPPVLEVVASGENEPFSYLWSVGNISPQIEPAQDSIIYSVTVTDALGCTAESMINYMAPIDLCAQFNVEINHIDSIPSLETSIFFGTLPFSYNWSEGSTTSFIFITPPGTFSVTVTDANGCTTEDEITL